MKHTITRLIALILTLVIFAGGGRADQVTDEEEWIWPDAPKTQQEETPSAEDETEGAEMAKIESWFDCDLKRPVQVQVLSGNVFSLDNNGSRIGVKFYDNGQKTTVTGSVSGRFILANGQTIDAITGTLATVNGQSVAYIDVPQSVLHVPGPLKITIQLTDSSVVTTVAAIIATVYQTKTDDEIVPSQQVIDDWNAAITQAIGTQNLAIANQDAKIDDLKSAIGEITGNASIQFSDPALKQYINTNVEVGTVVSWSTPSVSALTNIKWAAVECSQGDKFTINGSGGNGDRLWAFLDSDKKLTRKSNQSATANNLILTAEAGEAWLVINDETNKQSYKGELIGDRVNQIDDKYKNAIRYDIPISGAPYVLELYLNDEAIAAEVDKGMLFAVKKNVSGFYQIEFANAAGNSFTARTIARTSPDKTAIPIYKYSDASVFYGYIVIDWGAFSDGTTYPRKLIDGVVTSLQSCPIVTEGFNSFVIGCEGITELYLNEQAITDDIDKGVLYAVHKNHNGFYYIEFTDASQNSYKAKTIQTSIGITSAIPIYKYNDNTKLYGYVVIDWDAFEDGNIRMSNFIGGKATNLPSCPIIMDDLTRYALGSSEIVELYLNSTAIENGVATVHSIKKNDTGVYRVYFANHVFNTYKAYSSELTSESYEPIPVYSSSDSSVLYGYVVVNWDKLSDGVNLIQKPITDKVLHIGLCPLIKESVQGASDHRVDELEGRVTTLEGEVAQIDPDGILAKVDQEVAAIVAQQYTQDSVLFDTTPKSGHAAPYAVSSDGVWKALHQRRIITCGDSYLMDYTFNWGYKLRDMLGLSSSDFYRGGRSGGGFISLVGAPDNVGNGFLAGMQSIASSVTSPETITDIVVVGGLNDSSYSESDFPESTFATNVEAFISYCKTTYPNAKIWIGYCGNAADALSAYIGTRTIENRLFTIKRYSEITSDVQIAINTDIWKVFTYSYSWFNSTDRLHPTEESSIAIARAVMAWITGSPFSIKRSKFQIARTGSGTSLTNTQSKNFDAWMYNGVLSIRLNPWYAQNGYSADFLGTTSAAITPGSEIHIGSFNTQIVFNKDFETVVIMCYGDLTGSQKYAPASLKFKIGTGWYLTPFITETIASGTNLFLCGANVITIPAEYYV